MTPGLFEWLRMRIQNLRRLYFQTVFRFPWNITYWEAMMVDQLFFGRPDPISLIEDEVLYRNALRDQLLEISIQLREEEGAETEDDSDNYEAEESE